jgi:hypothetical protein
MATEVTRPDFKFAGTYYAELLEALVLYKRQNVPELTDESAYEPMMQFLRMEALIGHLSHVLLDLVANEVFLPTASLAESVRNHLRLIDYEMRPAAPAQADVVFELARAFSVATELVPTNARVGTKQQGNIPTILYEALTGLITDPTDVLSYALADNGGTFTDHTTAANAGTPWTPWTGAAVKDAIYFGHNHVMWDLLSVMSSVAAAGIAGVWEYYDGSVQDIAPTSVALNGPNLDIDLTSLLGTSNRAGTQVRVTLNTTGTYEEVESTWSGTANVCQTSLLGQSSPSTTTTDYTVGSEWKELPGLTDGTANLTASGDVDYTLPQTVTDDWIQGAVDDKTAFWLRYRITESTAPTLPDLGQIRITGGKQFALRQVTQGQTVEDSPLGSSDGTPNQEFETSRDYYINGTMAVYVDSELWTEVNDFLDSGPGSRVYSVELGANDRATIQFGNGASGRIPPTGANNIRCEYRVGGENDGNVGANQIVVDKGGLSFVNKLYNPRQATGWEEAEGASDTSLERVKVAGPATLRAKDVAIGPDDVVSIAQAYEDANGARPFARARAFEEGFGPKTIELIVVTSGGGVASAAQLEALDEYFNGDPLVSPPLPKRIVANQQVTSTNYAQRVIDVTATVTGDVTVAEVENRLQQILQPEALKADGSTYEWEFGGRVPVSRLIHEIFETDESITDVDVTVPAIDVELLPRELPVLGTMSITVA